MSENGEIYTAGKNFTLPPALTAWTNSTSDAKCKRKKLMMKAMMMMMMRGKRRDLGSSGA